MAAGTVNVRLPGGATSRSRAEAGRMPRIFDLRGHAAIAITSPSGGRMKFFQGSAITGALALASLLACPGVAWANPDVEKLTADPKNWAMQAGDMHNQRYSKLAQINAQNVGKMQVVWMFSTGVLRGHEGSPLV